MTMSDARSETPSDALARWLLSRYTPEELKTLDASLGWVPEAHQTAPDGDWTYWLMVAGRGAGKTDAGAHFVDRHALGPPCLPGPVPHRIAVAAPTLGDARETCVLGDSGLLSHDLDIKFAKMDGILEWPNGAKGRIFGAFTPEDVERWRGPQHCLVWADEFAAWRQLNDCWTHMRLGLRLGPHPRALVTTTPKPRPLLKELMERPDAVITRASTNLNPHLEQHVRNALYDLYAGTSLGRQELEGEIVDASEGALWTRERLERGRAITPPMSRVVVAIDPATTKKADSDETGIITAGLGINGQGYVLADDSLKGHPVEWARAAVEAYHTHKADRIVAEANQGGEMVEYTIRTVDPNVPITLVHASRGKRTRAEPVAALYEQDRVHHAMGASLALLEDQMCQWSASDGEDSPDRLDALVWAITELMLGSPWGSGPLSSIA